MTLTLPAVREWLTAAEAAAEALPGFGFKERQIRNWIAAGNIASRPRAGTRGREFCWRDLPAEARAEYLKRHGVAADETETDPVARADNRDLRAEARKKIVDAAKDFIERRGVGIGKGLKSFAKAYKARKTHLPGWVYGEERQAHPDQVRRWDRIIRKQGAGALCRARGRKKGSGLLERDLLLHNWISARLATMPHLTAARLGEMVALPEPHGLGRVIAKRTMQRHLAQFKASHKQALTILNNPDAGRSHYKPAFGSRSAAIERLNQLVEIDASPADVMCRLPNGSFIRVKLMAAVRVKSREAVVLVTDQPRARATMALSRRGLLQWGWIEKIKIDNGREFSNFAFERFCADAPYPIMLEFSDPYTPEQKPHVERFFGTLHRQFAEIAPGYIGHNVAQRTAIENRRTYADRFGRGEEATLQFETAYTPIQLQARIDRWCQDVYGQRPHESLNGLRPADVAASLAGDMRPIEDVRLLDALMLEAPDGHAIRVVGKRGIKLNNRIFGAPELGGILPDARRVHVRYDPADPDRLVVYNVDRTRFLCVAVAADALTNVERMHIARGMVAKYHKDARDLRAATRAFNKAYAPEGTLDALLAEAANDPFPISDDSKAGMIEAMRPSVKAIAQREALAALDHQDALPAAVEPSEEDYARMTAEMNPTPEPLRMIECGGYKRPAFDDDVDLIFWWEEFEADGGRLDEDDARIRQRLYGDEIFVDRLRVMRMRLAGSIKAATAGDQR